MVINPNEPPRPDLRPPPGRRNGQRQRRNWINTLIWVIVAALLLVLLRVAGTLAWQWFTASPTMPLRQINLSHPMRYGDVEAIKMKVASAPAAKDLMLIDLNLLANDIKTIPWVKAVSVQRQWPDALLLDIEERQPLFRWNNQDFIDEEGKRFTYQDRPEFKDIFNLQGVEGSEELMARVAHKVVPWLQARGLEASLLRRDEYRSWEIVVNGVRFILGNDQQLHSRLKLMVIIYKKHIEPIKDQVKAVDLRYANAESEQFNFVIEKRSQPAREDGPIKENKKLEAPRQ